MFLSKGGKFFFLIFFHVHIIVDDEMQVSPPYLSSFFHTFFGKSKSFVESNRQCKGYSPLGHVFSDRIRRLHFSWRNSGHIASAFSETFFSWKWLMLEVDIFHFSFPKVKSSADTKSLLQNYTMQFYKYIQYFWLPWQICYTTIYSYHSNRKSVFTFLLIWVKAYIAKTLMSEFKPDGNIT